MIVVKIVVIMVVRPCDRGIRPMIVVKIVVKIVEKIVVSTLR